MHWLGEARRRYELCILNYCVTSNHVHLLVRDQGEGEIARSMQLIQSRVAQEYNQERMAYLLDQRQTAREAQWTEAVAVGDPMFIERVQQMLRHVRVTWQMLASGEQDGTVCLKEAAHPYPDDFSVQNGVLTINFSHY